MRNRLVFKGENKRGKKSGRKAQVAQTLVEYTLLLALISLTVLVSLTLLSDEIRNSFDRTVTAIVNATGS